MRTPSYFLAAIRPRSHHRGALESESVFSGRGPGDTVTSVQCGGFDCCWLTSESTTVAASPRTRDVILVLHGELYADSGPTSAEACLEAYMKNEMGFLAELHGSFVLGVIDRSLGRVFFATDPVNSRMLFFGELDGIAWISTMHAFHLHPCSGKPDPAGLAHCLVNGVPMNGRTPFDGVRVLDRASIHEIQGIGVKSESYWRYWPQPRIDRSESAFKTDLRDILLTAVKRRLPSGGEVVLSLSGGYDSTAILGAFGHLGVPDVHCFTYRKPSESVHRSDASVARKMAAIAGYAHTEIEAYGDDVATVIGENVRWGHGLTRLVVETDTWRTLRGLLPADGQTTLWVADECFGMNPPRKLENRADVLNSLAFAHWSSLGPLKGLFPRSVASLLDDALRDDLKAMLERNRAIQDPYVLRDYLYLDQRLPRLLSWREAFAEPCGGVRNPLIDREILELRQRFPKHLTLGKCLYKDTVEEMFPELFATDRADAGAWFAGEWCREVVRTQSDDLARMIRTNPSPLDPYLPPDALLRVIEREASRAGMLRRLTRRARTTKGRVWKRIRTIGRPNPPALRPQQPAVDPAVFVLRAITLRELFRQRATG